MKIALPTTGTKLTDPMDSRFGRAAKFLIYDTEQETFVMIENRSAHATQGAGIRAAETITRAGATVVLTGDCGPKAFQVLNKAGIRVFGTNAPTVEKALKAYLSGSLSEMRPT